MVYEQGKLPLFLESRFEYLDTVKQDSGIAALMVRNRTDHRKMLLKCASADEDVSQLKNEYRLLSLIHQHDRESEAARSFPALIDCGEENGFWFAREWIEDRTLEALVEGGHGQPGIPRSAALDCLISVTEKLIFLHNMKPPVIHRDIKPQNVVVDEYGQCRLIDLGISRQFRPEQRLDTVISGTQVTAPPEQFGYQQTDERSDLYSCGILLRYTLTGAYEEKADADLDEKIRRIIRKATAFDPKQRYQSAEAMRADLLEARYGIKPRPALSPKQKRRLMIAALSAVLVLLAGWVILGTNLPGKLFHPDDQPYTFAEPLIEQAVRAELNKPEGILTRADLNQITAIHIYGKQIFQYEEQFWLRGEYDYCYIWDFQQSGLWEENGGISSLEDIRHMPNLSDLSLYNQNISDISALRGTQIARLGLAHNPIGSLSSLHGNENIVYLNISCLPLENLSDLSTLVSLRELNISSLPINSIELLTSLPLRRLQMYGVSLRNIWELQRLSELETVELQNLDQEGVLCLSKLQHLKNLTVTHPMGLPLKALEPLNALEQLYFYGGETTVPENGVVSLPSLRSLDIANGRFPDFKWLAGMPSLRQIFILNAEYGSLEGLDSAPLLMDITCGEPMASVIREAYPGAEWQLQ